MPDAAMLGDDAVALRAAARSRLCDWLLHGPAQLREGPHAGAVAGVIEAHGAPAYVYPEITGYYLQWLAYRARAGDARAPLAARAAAAQAWLARWAERTAPPARIYLEPRQDWRNAGLFTFDLAMVLRGIASAHAAELVAPARHLIVRLDALLVSLGGADGALAACRPYAGEAALPARWSTRPGSFLAKAAAGVLAAAALPGVSASLHDAAQRTFAAACARARSDPHAESHPLLYAMEGVLARGGDAQGAAVLPVIAAQLARLLAQGELAGRLPESAHDAGQARLDVHAQALRAGCVLAALGVANAPPRGVLQGLADALARRVTTAGGVPFSAATTTQELNVWAAMFAEQALAFVDMPPQKVDELRGWLV